MCADPATQAMFAISTASSVASYATETSATKSKNRSRIRAYEAEKQNYLNDIMLRNNQYNNEVKSFNVKEGDVVIFPSFLLHKASPNTSSKKRLIVSFNLDFEPS